MPDIKNYHLLTDAELLAEIKRQHDALDAAECELRILREIRRGRSLKALLGAKSCC